MITSNVPSFLEIRLIFLSSKKPLNILCADVLAKFEAGSMPKVLYPFERRISNNVESLEPISKTLISEYNLSNYCGSYVTSIDVGSLIYTIPVEKGFLTANCEFYDGNLENKLKSGLNISIN